MISCLFVNHVLRGLVYYTKRRYLREAALYNALSDLSRFSTFLIGGQSKKVFNAPNSPTFPELKLSEIVFQMILDH